MYTSANNLIRRSSGLLFQQLYKFVLPRLYLPMLGHTFFPFLKCLTVFLTRFAFFITAIVKAGCHGILVAFSFNVPTIAALSLLKSVHYFKSGIFFLALCLVLAMFSKSIPLFFRPGITLQLTFPWPLPYMLSSIWTSRIIRIHCKNWLLSVISSPLRLLLSLANFSFAQKCFHNLKVITPGQIQRLRWLGYPWLYFCRLGFLIWRI